jgi:hypothetical protein
VVGPASGALIGANGAERERPPLRSPRDAVRLVARSLCAWDSPNDAVMGQPDVSDLLGLEPLDECDGFETQDPPGFDFFLATRAALGET